MVAITFQPARAFLEGRRACRDSGHIAFGVLRKLHAHRRRALLARRMAAAKNLLRRKDSGLNEVAERVGYGSARAFSTAFSRHVGRPPGRYASRSWSS